MDDYDFSDYGGDYYFDPEAGGSGNNDFYSYGYQPSDLSWEDYLGSEQGFAPLSANFSDMSGYYPGHELMQNLGYQYTPTDDISSYLSQNPVNDLAANLGSEIGDASTADLIKASLTQQPGAGSIGEEQDMVNRGEAIDMMEAQQKLADMGMGIKRPFGNDSESGINLNKVHDLGGSLAAQDNSFYGLRAGAIDNRGMLGKGLEGNAGTGLMIAGAPPQAGSLADLQLLDQDPNATLDAWAKNQEVPWQEYAQANNYDPYDIGTDARWLLGNSLPSAGYGGVGGKGIGSTLSPARMAEAIKAGEQSAGAGGKSTSANKELTTAEKVKTGLGVANMAALAAALLGGGNKKGPKSLQGDINANAWEVARMKNRGQAPSRYAEGGLASIKEAIQKMAGMKGKPAAVVRKEEYIVPPTTEDIRDFATQGSGMYQNAARALTGRQRQLELLEQEAMGKAMGGVVMPQAVMPNLIRHASGGQADKIPARLSGGEYIMDADIVSALGDGNTDAGAAKLDQMREAIRQHKRSGSNKKIPPAAKSPLEYMKGRR